MGVTAGVPTIDGNNPDLRAVYPTVPQGISADLIATLEGFGREVVDAYAAQSQSRAAVAIEERRFDRSLVDVAAPAGRLEHDEHPRPGTTTETLSRLTPAFEAMGAARADGEQRTFDEICLERYPGVDRIDHVHHAGNSSGVVDGAAAVLLASSNWMHTHRVTRGRRSGRPRPSAANRSSCSPRPAPRRSGAWNAPA